jgi:ATP-binding cassette subfamily B protein
MLLEVSTTLRQPRLVRHIIDVGIARGDLGVVLHTGAKMLALTMIGMVGGLGCLFTTVLVVQRFGRDLRDHLFRKVQSLSYGNLDRLQTGSLITRLTNDVNQVQEALTMFLRHGVRILTTLFGSVIMAAYTSPRLAVIFLFLIPVVFAVLTVLTKRAYPMYGRVQHRLDALNTVLQENLAGVRVIKAFARARHEMGRFRLANDQLVNQNISAARLGAATAPLTALTLNCGIVAALWLGGIHVNRGGLQVGQVVAFLTYVTQTLYSLMMTSMLTMQFSRARVSAKRVMEVLGMKTDIEDGSDTQPLRQVQGRITFEKVTFSYDPYGQDSVLKDISFEVEPGQTLAVLGATGSGKSSLVALLARLYQPSSGRITLDGEDLAALREEDLRRHIVVVPQEAVLFSGSIRDNIAFGRPEATLDEIVAAAQAAQAHEFIIRLPEGYETPVLRRGVNLSGGQKQRLSIARALLLRPRVLVLDDSTSAVDVHTQDLIYKSIENPGFTQTRIIVAQSTHCVRHADKIVLLDDGELVGEGTHHDLLQSNLVYREIYESQQEHVIHHASLWSANPA